MCSFIHSTIKFDLTSSSDSISPLLALSHLNGFSNHNSLLPSMALSDATQMSKNPPWPFFLEVFTYKILNKQWAFDHSNINLMIYILRYIATENHNNRCTDVSNLCTVDRTGMGAPVDTQQVCYFNKYNTSGKSLASNKGLLKFLFYQASNNSKKFIFLSLSWYLLYILLSGPLFTIHGK